MAMFDWIRKSLPAGAASTPPRQVAQKAARASGSAESCKNQGNVHLSQGELAAAADCYREAIELNPGYAEAYNNLGSVLSQQNQLDAAIECLRKALVLKPTLVQAGINLGNALRSKGLSNEALAAFHAALALAPASADAHNNLAVLLHELGRLDEAAESLRTAISLEPWFAQAFVNLGLVLQDKGSADEAEECFRKALPLSRPGDQTARYCLSILMLARGRLVEGWADYDARFWHAGGTYKRPFSYPEWRGEDLQGRRLLIWGDQGLGDEIMFASMFGEAIARTEHCVVECVEKLVPLFARSFPDAEVVPRTTPPHPATRGDFDFQCSAGGLARWLRADVQSFPQHRSFLAADPGRIAYWSSRLGELGDGLKVGICWRSRLRTGVRELHYSSIDQWGGVFAVPGVHFVNLQYDECRDELAEARERFGIALHAFPEVDLLDDLDEAAALTRVLDLVITAPTSTARLAAALGVPTWEMAYGNPWICLGTGRLPWFPTARLFRRAPDQSRESMISAVANELRTLTKERATPTAEACKNRGNLHLAKGELEAAAASYLQALAADPSYAEAMNNLGLVLSQQGKTDEAIAWFEKALSFRPDLAHAHVNLGNVLKGKGRQDDAAACFHAALAAASEFPAAHVGLGVVRLEQGRIDDAIQAFRRAIDLRADVVEAHLNLGTALQEKGKAEEAKESFARAVALDPQRADAHNALGCLLQEQGDFATALECFLSARAAKPDHAGALLNLGNAYRELLEPAKAQSHYEELLARDPANAGALNNLGMALQDQGRLEDAEAAFRRSLAIAPGNPATRFYLSCALLTQGKLEEGWRNYECRFFEGSGVAPRNFPFPRWSGQSLEGKSLLIWGDQGLGDEILFASQFNEIAACARRCVVECTPKIESLFARSFPGVEVVPRTDPPHLSTHVAFDFQIAAGDLARWLRPTLDSFPQQDGYLMPDPGRLAYWKARLRDLGRGLKVGICWRSGLHTGSRHLHYTSLDQWGPIFAVPGVQFVNLQYDRCGDELAAARKRFDVCLHAFEDVDLFNDIDEAAALTGALDLVITAPTSASRLAAAQGVPTWEMIYGRTWVALGAADNPWLPSQTTFCRGSEGSWEALMAEVAGQLRSFGAAHG